MRRLLDLSVVLVVLATLGGCGVRGSGSADDVPVRALDPRTGVIDGVRLGDDVDDVLGRWGEPARRGGFAAPADEEPGFRGPYAIAWPVDGIEPDVLRYDGVALLAVEGRVFAIIGGRGVATDGFRTGDPLSAARAAYPALTCRERPDGEPLPGFDPPTHPECAARVDGNRLVVAGDPIESITVVGGSG